MQGRGNHFLHGEGPGRLGRVLLVERIRLHLDGDAIVVLPVGRPSTDVAVDEVIDAQELILHNVDQFMEEKLVGKLTDPDLGLRDQDAVDQGK